MNKMNKMLLKMNDNLNHQRFTYVRTVLHNIYIKWELPSSDTFKPTMDERKKKK